MRIFIKTVSFILYAILFIQCEKEETDPNENWIPGRKWEDTRDSHLYATIPIGDQIWMAENITYLPSVNNVQDGSEDEGYEDAPFYYVYDYDGTDTASAKASTYYKQFGVLYNCNAASTACPDGWHLPSDGEWVDLEIYLGMTANKVFKDGNRGTDEGFRLKSTWGWNYLSWNDRYGNGSNETGFTGLPGGSRFMDATSGLSLYRFGAIGYGGFWWTATKIVDTYGFSYRIRSMSYSDDKVGRYNDYSENANSVRCIKD